MSEFDWSSLDRATLFGMLSPLEEKIVNKPLTAEQLHTKLTNQIKKFLPVRFKKQFDPKVTSGYVFIGGAYYSDKDWDGEKSIEVNFNYQSKKAVIKMSKLRFSRMCIVFADVILHELIHMRQHRRREWRVLPDFPSTASRTKQREAQGYLGCRDEIDAYSFNIACELVDMFNGHQTKIVRHLNKSQKNLTTKHNSYTMYLNAFGHDHNHPVIKKLKKKVVSYLPQALQGKPYKNGDWINY